jgi:hypothetical protein
VKHWPQKLQRFGENKTGMVYRAGLSVEPRVRALDNRTLLRDSTPSAMPAKLESVLIGHLRRPCERVELLPGTDAVDLRGGTILDYPSSLTEMFNWTCVGHFI